jgi:hypothetical protein
LDLDRAHPQVEQSDPDHDLVDYARRHRYLIWNLRSQALELFLEGIGVVDVGDC